MAGNIVEISDSNFDLEVLDSDLVTLVDFWAPWCGPCAALAPTIEAIANEQKGKIKVCKLNVDENPESAAKYGIRGIPTIIIFKNGAIAKQITGSVPKNHIEEVIKSV